MKIDYDKVCEENYKLKNEEIESQKNNIRNEINNRIILIQNIRVNNNNNYNYNNRNEIIIIWMKMILIMIKKEKIMFS